ncbi:hypothetical protein DSO57_1025260 [Entomophthora muscae]|uniref:Uncharacterized protein n=1 Tax=Entomophthora muscae TaxID=34485 RepID=A0ACC2U0Y5_9FUNG|nr:hypothetical protein DSO57_1025260 [Entomophthora muscae]
MHSRSVISNLVFAMMATGVHSAAVARRTGEAYEEANDYEKFGQVSGHYYDVVSEKSCFDTLYTCRDQFGCGTKHKCHWHKQNITNE